MTTEEKPGLTLPISYIAFNPVEDPTTGDYHSEGALMFEWPGKGTCAALFKSQNSARLYASQHIISGDFAGMIIRDKPRLIEILLHFQQQGAEWVAVDPLDTSDESECYSIQEEIHRLEEK